MGTLTSTSTARVVHYSVGSTASAGPFDIPFTFADEDQVSVYVNGTEITTFGVTQASEFSTSGNTVTLETAVSNSTVTIVSNTDATRLTADTFTISDLSKEIDNIYAQLQEIAYNDKFKVKGYITDPTSLDFTLPSVDNRKGKYLSFNSTTGAPEVLTSIAERITISTSSPSGGSDGDLWFKLSS